jgi:hypothetical protein
MRDAWLSFLIAFVFVVFCQMISPHKAWPHESWLNKTHNRMGWLCCGPEDCGEIKPDPIGRPDGWHIDGVEIVDTTGRQIEIHEVVPYSEEQPSQDGRFIRCHTVELATQEDVRAGVKIHSNEYGSPMKDGARRCFFAPPKGS